MLLTLHVRKSYPYIEEGAGGLRGGHASPNIQGILWIWGDRGRILSGEDKSSEDKSSPSPPGQLMERSNLPSLSLGSFLFMEAFLSALFIKASLWAS